jgi:hypothetical protein
MPLAVAFISIVIAVAATSSSGLLPLGEGSAPATEGSWEMAEAFSPVLRFSSGERTFPAPVEYFLERSSLVDLAGTVVAERPSEADLELAGPLLFLDLEARDPIRSYENDRQDIDPTVYARASEAGGRIILQYWLFYVFNDGRLNDHEGDWEMVQVTLSPDGSAENIVLSQHHSGDLAPWDSLTEVVNGTHPVITVSLGSHANYEPGALAVGHGDSADGLGEEWMPEDYSLVRMDTATEGGEPSWLRYEGAWGEPAGSLGGALGREGPQGPMFRENGKMWGGLYWW